MEWDAPSGFNLVSTMDTTVSMDDTYTSPYKLSFTMPTAPLIFDRVLIDLNGSRLNPSCVDPNDDNFLYPLFSRIVIALDFNNDIFYDEICAFIPKKDTITTKTLILNRPLPYLSTSSNVILLLFPTSACSSNLHKIVLNRVIFETPTVTTTAPAPAPATPTTTSVPTTITSMNKSGILAILVIAIFIILFFIIYNFVVAT